jgi:ribosomal protein S12 methylthiotransferase
MTLKKSVALITLGCSKNLVDSEKLMRQFESIGYQISHDKNPEKGSIAIVNTCGFIGDAKEESVNTILELARAKKKGYITKLFVMGCLSERYIKDLPELIPEVDKFYGKFNWNEIITDLGHTWNSNFTLDRHLTTPSHYAYLKISEGCSRKCSYCSIPIITGSHKSRAIEEILEEVKLLVSKGVKEFQLIAQDLSYYGIDKYKKPKLAQLVEKISEIEGVEWLRIHYTYPYGFPMDLLKVIREKDNVCAYLDMALQHISDNMLIKMRRNISKDETFALINKIREDVPGIHLRTTLMVGHPGETEKDFDELMEFAKEMKFERMGAFVYSEEEGTYSARHYKDDIPEEIKKERLDKLMLLQQNISEEINRQKIGKVFKVIIDREEEDFYIGRTEFDSPEVDPEVFIDKNIKLETGKFYKILITSSGPYDISGKVATV